MFRSVVYVPIIFRADWSEREGTNFLPAELLWESYRKTHQNTKNESTVHNTVNILNEINEIPFTIWCNVLGRKANRTSQNEIFPQNLMPAILQKNGKIYMQAVKTQLFFITDPIQWKSFDEKQIFFTIFSMCSYIIDIWYNVNPVNFHLK